VKRAYVCAYPRDVMRRVCSECECECVCVCSQRLGATREPAEQTMLLVTHGDALAAWLSALEPGMLVYQADFCAYIRATSPSGDRMYNLDETWGVHTTC
jgi:hypothetical protein